MNGAIKLKLSSETNYYKFTQILNGDVFPCYIKESAIEAINPLDDATEGSCIHLTCGEVFVVKETVADIFDTMEMFPPLKRGEHAPDKVTRTTSSDGDGKHYDRSDKCCHYCHFNTNGWCELWHDRKKPTCSCSDFVRRGSFKTEG